MTKVYASNGEPCCAECITPVFDETWSPRSSGGGTGTLTARNGTRLSPAVNRKRDSCGAVRAEFYLHVYQCMHE